MGYELHITRAKHRTDNRSSPIAAEEWLTFVEADPELSIDNENGPYFAIWSAFGDESWFDWRDGEIVTKNPDRETLGKMLEIAEHFGANVQGDDGETYKAPDQLPE